MSAQTEASDALAAFVDARTAREAAEQAVLDSLMLPVTTLGVDGARLTAAMTEQRTTEAAALSTLITKLIEVEVTLPE